MTTLSERELQVLAMERRRFLHHGVKDETVKVELDLSRTRYEQLLSSLLDRPEALVHDPQLINRLRRLREQRQWARSARRLAG